MKISSEKAKLFAILIILALVSVSMVKHLSSFLFTPDTAAASPYTGDSNGKLISALPQGGTETCGEAKYDLVELPFNEQDTTTGHTDDYNLGLSGICSGGGEAYSSTGLGPDTVYKLQTNLTCTLQVDLDPDDTDNANLALYVLNPNCSNEALNCVIVDDSGLKGVAEHVSFTATAGQDYYIIIDGYAGDSGTFNISVSETTSTGCSLIGGTAALGNSVWNDINLDGIQDTLEPILSNISVDLFSCSGTYITSTLTYSGYLFTNLNPGSYYLDFDLPADWLFSPQDQGEDNLVDSDTDPMSGLTPCTDLSAGEFDSSWDAGMFETYSLGDMVWDDTNRNGILDVGEQGVENIGVDLYQNNDCSGEKIKSDITDSVGRYSFTNLPSSLYCLSFLEVPSGWSITEQNQGVDDALDSDVDPDTGFIQGIQLSGDDHSQDMGIYPNGSIGDKVWYDSNRNGVFDDDEPGVENIRVDIFPNDDCSGEKIASDITDSAGNYGFSNLPSSSYCLSFLDIPAGWSITEQNQGDDDALDSDVDPSTGFLQDMQLNGDDNSQDLGIYANGSIGDRVWCDDDDNKQFTEGEGVQGVRVNLSSDNDCDGEPNNLLTFQDTIEDGAYLFTGLPAGPSSNSPECYVVAVDPSKMGLCSIPISPLQYLTELEADSAIDLDKDFGFKNSLGLGDLVWNDLDRDGIQGNGEPGIAGITIEVSNSEGNCQGPTIASSTTDANGTYQFDGLAPGTYCIRLKNLPIGWVFSPQDKGKDDSIDSDANPGGMITKIELTETDPSLDIGIYQDNPRAKIWFDEGHQEVNTLSWDRAVDLSRALPTNPPPEEVYFGQLKTILADEFEFISMTIPIQNNSLGEFDALFLSVPGKALDLQESNAVRQYIKAGGGLILTGNCNYIDPNSELWSNYGFSFSPSCLFVSESTPSSDIVITNFSSHPAVSGVVSTTLNAGSSLKIFGDAFWLSDTAGSYAWEDTNSNNQYDKGEEGIYNVIAGYDYGCGRIALISDNSFQDAGFWERRNDILMRALLRWVTAGQSCGYKVFFPQVIK